MFVLALGGCAAVDAPVVEDELVPEVDMIVVEKSKRVLHLMSRWQPVHSFAIALGQSPVGHKRQAGDSRTPEGSYHIDGRNPDSKFFLSLHISYPNLADRVIAARDGRDPGGDIMIHGEPNDPELRNDLRRDWTAGCIALSNGDMQIVWDKVREGTPVLIRP